MDDYAKTIAEGSATTVLHDIVQEAKINLPQYQIITSGLILQVDTRGVSKTSLTCQPYNP